MFAFWEENLNDQQLWLAVSLNVAKYIYNLKSFKETDTLLDSLKLFLRCVCDFDDESISQIVAKEEKSKC